MIARPWAAASGLLLALGCGDEATTRNVPRDAADTSRPTLDAQSEVPEADGASPSPVSDASVTDVSLPPDATPEAAPDARPVDAADADASPEVTAPTLRSVILELPGGAVHELTSGELVLGIAAPIVVTFVVRATHASLTAEQLSITLIDASGAAVPWASETFTSGLWTFSVELFRDSTLSLQVDAGGAIAASGRLVLPSALELMQGTWSQALFDTTLSVVESRTFDVNDASWTETRSGGLVRRGTLSIDDPLLTLSETLRSDSGETDAGAATVDWERAAFAFVDDTVLGLEPYARTSGSGVVEGTWARSRIVSSRDAADAGPVGALSVVEDVTETLTFGPGNAWLEVTTGSGAGLEGGTVPVDTSVGGTYLVEVSGSYTGVSNVFLRRIVTSRDGVAVPPEAERVENIDVRSGYLVFSPWTR